MYFGRNNINTNNMMSMSNGTTSRIDFVEQCTHLGTIIYSDITRKNVDFAVNDLFMRTNKLTRMAEPIPPSGQSSSYSLTTISSPSSTDRRAETDRMV